MTLLNVNGLTGAGIGEYGKLAALAPSSLHKTQISGNVIISHHVDLEASSTPLSKVSNLKALIEAKFSLNNNTSAQLEAFMDVRHHLRRTGCSRNDLQSSTL